MGCHTWFYRKLNPQPTYQMVKQDVLDMFEKNRELYVQMIDGTLDEDLKEAYPEWDMETGLKVLPIIERTIHMVEGGFCKVAVCNRYVHEDLLTVFVNENFYVSDYNLPHDLFRIGKYPKNRLFSLSETMEFIEKNKENVYFYIDDFENHLNKFWSENPDGMIEFG